jgi:hypothetical protein
VSGFGAAGGSDFLFPPKIVGINLSAGEYALSESQDIRSGFYGTGI